MLASSPSVAAANMSVTDRRVVLRASIPDSIFFMLVPGDQLFRKRVTLDKIASKSDALKLTAAANTLVTEL